LLHLAILQSPIGDRSLLWSDADNGDHLNWSPTRDQTLSASEHVSPPHKRKKTHRPGLRSTIARPPFRSSALHCGTHGFHSDPAISPLRPRSLSARVQSCPYACPPRRRVCQFCSLLSASSLHVQPWHWPAWSWSTPPR